MDLPHSDIISDLLIHVTQIYLWETSKYLAALHNALQMSFGSSNSSFLGGWVGGKGVSLTQTQPLTLMGKTT